MNEKTQTPSLTRVAGRPSQNRKITKKERILELHGRGMTDLGELAQVTGSRISYVASVLQGAGRISGYFDLYTASSRDMNVYSPFFKGRLGFRNEDIARRSVYLLNRVFEGFERDRDRAGQHHALGVALTMFDRARWSGHRKEAALFRHWLISKLYDPEELDETAH